jgi:muramoyltetrapeptide carboxypeptidase
VPDLRCPRPVRERDGVAIVSTSSPVKPDDLDRLVAYFEGRGHPVTVMPHTGAATGYLAGPATDRAADLAAAFADPSIRLVMPAEGGEGAATLLPLLDFDLIGESEKVFVGLSDTSILANAIATRANLAALHGPTGHSFSQPAVDPYTEEWFWRIVSGPVAGLEVDGEGWRVPQGSGSVVSGPVVGGHLRTIRTMVGTSWMPDLRGAIFVVEEVEVTWAQIDSALTHLRLAGVFDQIAALLVGAPRDCVRDDSPDASWDEMILRASGVTCPVVTEAELGHTARKFGLGIGCRVELDLAGERPLLRYAEDFVSD